MHRIRKGAARLSTTTSGTLYPASRKRFMDLLSEAEVDNVVVLTGDIHQFLGE